MISDVKRIVHEIIHRKGHRWSGSQAHKYFEDLSEYHRSG